MMGRGSARRVTELAALVLLLVLGACDRDGIGPIVCTDEARPALRVTVVEAGTNMPVNDPIVWARRGGVVDTLDVVGNVAQGPGEVAGTYDVRAKKAGYATWSRDGVEVEATQCGPVTGELLAELTPAS